MDRTTERIFRLNDEINALRRNERQAAEELAVLRALDDDARLDAIDGDPFDRADARRTAGDVARLEGHLTELRSDRTRLERRRDQLLEAL
jgi:hypothetical protein